LKPPPSPYLVAAGSIVPAVLVTGVSSELPSQNLGAGSRERLRHGDRQMASDFLREPAVGFLQQPSRIRPDSNPDCVASAESFLTRPAWSCPTCLALTSSGYAGFKDQVNNHMIKTYGSALLVSLIGAGQAVAQMGCLRSGRSWLWRLRQPEHKRHFDCD